MLTQEENIEIQTASGVRAFAPKFQFVVDD